MMWNKETIKQPATQEQSDLFEKSLVKNYPINCKNYI
jgi:hypothetical protein